MFKSEIIYDLISPIEINSGETVDSLILKAPTNSCRTLAVQLTKKVSMAISEMSEKYSDKIDDAKAVQQESTGISGDLIVGAIYSANSVDADECFSIFQKLMLTNQLCKMTNGHQMTQIIYNSLYVEDVSNMLGVYLENFCLPSHMKKKTSSK